MSAAEEAAAPLTRSGEEISWHHRLRDLAETDDRQALDHATLEAVDGALEQGAHLVLTAKDRQNQAATALALEARAKAAASNLASARAEHGSAVKGQHTASTELEAAQQRLEAVLQEQTKAPDRDEERAAQEVEEARTVLMSAQRADTLDLEVHAARERRDAARTEEREAYSAQVALFTARSQAMALALAQDLVPGGPCTVCGSVEHPAPATAGGDGSPEHSHADLGQGALDAAQHRAETARQNESTCQESLTQAEQRHANAATKAHGLSVEAARAALQHAIEDHEEVVKAWRAHRGAVERLGAAQQRVASCTAALETARNVVTQSQQYLEGAKHHDEESRAAAQEALAGHPDGQSMVEAAETERTALDRTVRSLETLRTALTSLRDAGTRAHAELEHSGQAAGAVREHLLPEPQAQAIRTELTALDTERARLEELEASAPVRRAQAARDAGETPPDEQAVAALEETRHHAEQAQDAASAVVGAARSVVADVQRARDRVTQADRELGPLLDQARTAKSVAELMAGNGENLKGMSLPTYVLAARLETVAEAATHRLAAMGEGRYRLLHQDGKQGNRHSGLGLAVEDAWTGATRAPETLSGGETFMVSLALALGLADVVQEESGGIDVETLFVDEGFGTLDQQTLDDVLNGLDRLRAGGRLVGIVSHVPELAERIPTQIRVTKTRAGSTTSVVTAAGPE
jgi:exonuclease SbcC